MDPPRGPNSLPSPLLDGAQVRSDPRPEARITFTSQTSKRPMCRARLDDQKTVFSELTGKKTKDSCVRVHSASSHRPEEETTSPLRLALARRSVKERIFSYMDHGDKKTDIECRTGLSHRCIKWHRRLWRNEGCHPRPRSKKLSKSSVLRSQSPSTRSQRSSRKRPASDGEGDSSGAGESSSGKRRRKHRAVKQSEGRSINKGTEMTRAESETKIFGCFAGKENVPGKEDIMVMSGELKVLPIRNLGSPRD